MRAFLTNAVGPLISNVAIAAFFVIGGLWALMPNRAMEVIDGLMEWSEAVWKTIRLHHGSISGAIAHLAMERWLEGAGIGDFAAKELKAGKTNDQVLEAVREQFPSAGTSLGSCAWYRSKLRKSDISVPTDAQARRLQD